MQLISRQNDPLGGAWVWTLDANARAYRTLDDIERAGGELRPATVPGNVGLDLAAAGLVGDPFRGLPLRPAQPCAVRDRPHGAGDICAPAGVSVAAGSAQSGRTHPTDEPLESGCIQERLKA